MSYSDNIRNKNDADGQQTVNFVTAPKAEVVWQVHTHIMILLFAVKLDSPPLWKQAVSSCHLLQKNKWQPFRATFHVYMSWLFDSWDNFWVEYDLNDVVGLFMLEQTTPGTAPPSIVVDFDGKQKRICRLIKIFDFTGTDIYTCET